MIRMKKLVVCAFIGVISIVGMTTPGVQTSEVQATNNDYREVRDTTKGVIIHNDASTLQGSQYKYLESYNDDQLARGFAHYYVAAGDIYQFHDDSKVAWHAGNFSGNTEYVGIEATGSMGDQARFLANEQEALKVAAKVLYKYGLKPTRDTVRLHREFFNTACPHRSWALHGQSLNAVKDYFISQIQKYMNEIYPEATGYIDNLQVQDNTIKIRGWHTGRDTKATQLRYMFIMEAGTTKELARVKIENKSRFDVAKYFPGISSAEVSGFELTIPVQDGMKGKSIYVITRYSPGLDENVSVSDMLFTSNKLAIPDYRNLGYVDNMSISDNTVRITGWHAAEKATSQNQRYLFIMDADTGKEIQRMPITSVSRPDVNRVVPFISTASMSGFDIKIPLTSELRGKKIFAVTRYIVGNNPDASIADKWFTESKIALPGNQNVGYIDELNVSSDKLNIKGWHATTKASAQNKRYLFIMDADTGKELQRVSISNVNRPDVERALPAIETSKTSGFDITIPVAAHLKGKKIFIVTRYMPGTNPDASLDDMWFVNKTIAV